MRDEDNKLMACFVFYKYSVVLVAHLHRFIVKVEVICPVLDA